MSRAPAKNALGLGDYGSEDEEAVIGSEEEANEDDNQMMGYAEGRTLTPGGEAVSGAEPTSEQISTGASWGSAGRDEAADAAGVSGRGIPSSTPQYSFLQGLPLELQQPPPGEASPELVAKFAEFSRKRKLGMVFNDSLRNHKGYRNPDLLTKLVELSKVEQYGSAFDKEVFDPLGLPEEDKIGSLIAQWERDAERKKQARAQGSAGVDFQRGGTILPGVLPAGMAPSTSGSDARNQGMVTAAMLKQQAAFNAALAVNMAAQAVKRSKWDSSSAK